MWSWYLQNGVYVGMADLKGMRVERDHSDWWLLDARPTLPKMRAVGPFRASEDAREAAPRRLA